jgi:hypothetical protein
LLSTEVVGDKQLFCPNNGTPKPGIKCLPGENDNNVCGDGYSCFFSGLNYHCCPSGDETNERDQGECPDYTFAILDSNGKSIRCSSLGKECSGANAYCNENSPTPICCQNLKSADNQQTTEKQQRLQAVEDFFSADEEPATTPGTSKEECPKNALVVLTEDGELTYCTSESDCPQV